MSKKISDFFKVDPKKSKVEKISQSYPKIRDCRIILEDINKIGKIQENEPKNHQINPATSATELANGINSETKKKSATQTDCEFCGLKMLRRSINRHIQRHHPTKVINLQIICEICNQLFYRISNLNTHTFKVHPETIKPKHFECDFDGKIFTNRVKFCIHMRSHERKIKCSLCQIELSPFYLKYHIACVHKNDRNNQCKICQKSFKSAQTLKGHVKSHDKKFECPICTKLFPTQGTLNIHIKFYHENPKSFECEECGIKFNLKCAFKKHQKTHDKNRPKLFKCQKCNYATDSRYNLKIHIVTHENQYKKFANIKDPLKCEKCLKFFKNKFGLNQHMKRVHLKDLFQCDLCGKYLKAKSDLSRHIVKRVCQK